MWWGLADLVIVLHLVPDNTHSRYLGVGDLYKHDVACWFAGSNASLLKSGQQTYLYNRGNEYLLLSYVVFFTSSLLPK